MKLQEFAEHQKSARLTPLPAAQVLQHLQDGRQLDTMVGAPGIGSVALFRDELDSDHHVVVLARRTEQSVPIGYVVLARPHHTERWQVVDVELQPALRGKGLITNVYRGLTAAGYRLRSGDVLSDQAEGVWRALGRAGIAQVLDTQTGELQPFSDLPVGDGDLAAGKKARFYWVTEGQRLLTVYYRGGALSEEQRADWLAGAVASRERSHLYGVDTFLIEAEV